MERADYNLAYLLRYENIAWYENGEVRILDRRIYPKKKSFVTCKTYLEVRDAIRDMVTQSAGPYTAAPMGIALAAWECKDLNKQQQIEYIKKAALEIADARPTTKAKMSAICQSCIPVAERAMSEGKPVDIAIRNHVIESNNIRYNEIAKTAEYLVDMFPNDGKILTQCFAETILGMMLRECKNRGKNVKLFCPETRPYFQGARLTASVCSEMGFETTVITDNMPAYVMANEKIDVFTCAADVIARDGYVFNKVGTSQIAIAAKYFGIPMFVTGSPDKYHITHDTVKIEMRNPDESLEAMGVRTAPINENIKGYYPAFDMTPPHLISGIVTSKGIFSPYDLNRYFK